MVNKKLLIEGDFHNLDVVYYTEIILNKYMLNAQVLHNANTLEVELEGYDDIVNQCIEEIKSGPIYSRSNGIKIVDNEFTGIQGVSIKSKVPKTEYLPFLSTNFVLKPLQLLSALRLW